METNVVCLIQIAEYHGYHAYCLSKYVTIIDIFFQILSKSQIAQNKLPPNINKVSEYLR